MLKKFVCIIFSFYLFLMNFTFAEETTRKTIAIDLDGVLDNYEKYTDDIPKIKKGAKEFTVKLSKDYDLILFTTRSPKIATEWLIENNINQYFKEVTNVKPLATMLKS